MGSQRGQPATAGRGSGLREGQENHLKTWLNSQSALGVKMKLLMKKNTVWAPSIGKRHHPRSQQWPGQNSQAAFFSWGGDNCTYSPKLPAVLTVLLWHLLSHKVNPPSGSVCPASPHRTKDVQHCTAPHRFSSHSSLLPQTPGLLQAEASTVSTHSH